ncbi:MAG: guanylate kinase [Oscillospiraceae bacterium]|nr:guanylate kinase [Oscillospiraceae bacterium]
MVERGVGVLFVGSGKLVVLAGPSGVGKGAVISELLKSKENLKVSVSATTRKKRDGEKEGLDYFFKTVSEFEALIQGDMLLEYASYNSNYYGTPKKGVMDALSAGRDVVLEIEVQGALQIKAKRIGAVLIFLSPPSMEELEKRLRGRGTETETNIKKRLEIARQEMKSMSEFDHVIVNNNSKEAACELLARVFGEKGGSAWGD